MTLRLYDSNLHFLTLAWDIGVRSRTRDAGNGVSFVCTVLGALDESRACIMRGVFEHSRTAIVGARPSHRFGGKGEGMPQRGVCHSAEYWKALAVNSNFTPHIVGQRLKLLVRRVLVTG